MEKMMMAMQRMVRMAGMEWRMAHTLEYQIILWTR